MTIAVMYETYNNCLREENCQQENLLIDLQAAFSIVFVIWGGEGGLRSRFGSLGRLSWKSWKSFIRSAL